MGRFNRLLNYEEEHEGDKGPVGQEFGDGKQISARAVSGLRFSQRFHGVPVRVSDGTKAYPGSD
jgi:hypothetical protein